MAKILKFLGCGSAFNPIWGNTCAYFQLDSRLFLIDCGETVFSELFERKMLEQYTEIYVLITHTHGDHVGSLGSLISYSHYVLKKKVIVVYPESSLQKLLDLMGIGRNAYTLRECSTTTFHGINIEAIAVKHASDIKSYGYIITTDLQTLYYSGDSYEIPESVLQEFFEGGIDAIFQDTTNVITSHKSHLPLTVLAELIPEKFRNKVFCMHFSSDFSDDIKQMGFKSVRDYVES